MAKLVSKVYGDALFEATKEANKLDVVYEEVQQLLVILKENAELQKMLESPKIIREDKENVIETVFRGRISDEIVELIKLMIAKGRVDSVEAVFQYFIGLVKEEKKIGIAYVTSAMEVTDKQKKEIEKKLLETTKYESFEMNYDVDESLIGGMVIRIGDRVVDSSIKTKLYDLAKNLRTIQV